MDNVSPIILLDEYENLGFLGFGISKFSVSGVGNILGYPYTSDEDAKKNRFTFNLLSI